MNEFENTVSLPCALYTADQVRILDRWVMDSTGLSSLQLMDRAAESALNVLLENWPGTHRLCVLVGTGNNAGDGYLLAHHAAARKIAVRVFEAGDQRKLGPEPSAARQQALSAGVSCEPFNAGFDLGAAQDVVLVDALLGIGMKGAPREGLVAAIDWLNDNSAPVLSIDIPSGLDSDTGMASAQVVDAQVTVTFLGLKRGMFTGLGPQVCGRIVYRSLGVADAVASCPLSENLTQSRLDFNAVKGLLKPRHRDSHKGSFGNVLVLGGDAGFGGAAIMSAEAAARSGAGTVTLVTRTQNVSAALARCPEIMVLGIDEWNKDTDVLFKRHIARANAIVVGPGLGLGEWGRTLLSNLLMHGSKQTPLLLDADALNIVASRSEEARSSGGQYTFSSLKRRLWVMTPHPGEAARLLESPVEKVQANRFEAAKKLSERWGGVTVLKGAGSIVCYQDPVSGLHLDVCTEGNPGMASGGMGDVLSGIIGGLMAQGLSVEHSTQLGVCVHGEAADLAAQIDGERGLLATDLLPFVRRLLNDY